MKCITTSLNYGDYLSWTLPENVRHFAHTILVTSPSDELSIRIGKQCGAEVLETDVFTAKGEQFNKYAAIELALDHVGRDGWITLLDADIMLPSDWYWPHLIEGNLYGPHRRMCYELPLQSSCWGRYPRCERLPIWFFSGYMQTFYGGDPRMGNPPWHGEHSTAARGDMVMMEKWPRENRIRLPHDVLHLGMERKNWGGRVTPAIPIRGPYDILGVG